MTYLIGVDRDNTLVEDKGYLGSEDNWKEHVKILPGVIEGLKILKGLDAKIIVASNQSGIARELYTAKRAEDVCNEITRMLKKDKIILDGWYFSVFVDATYAEHAGIKDRKWIKNDGMRKPGTGMLKLGAKENGLDWTRLVENGKVFFIGDKDEDMLTGINAGGHSVYVPSKITRKEHKLKVKALKKKYSERIYIAKDFVDACRWIEKKIENL
ncbi:hypothetical protein CO038_04175 [Candidatus Pacearchaeota archaeon CG_4_9_14_0_2_um_filter_39_13]|nr:HAD-IIIA family hydrolase [Candidatus Pacearchaeota archaeon]OIO44091.1 MAG: hypothetical protein AUJ64_00530 [Candidatus Pacearchaeota archaeon CG1_02_39_14]PJC44381.1 MAG: hypothetical protein CO038_04175 [Candidatus Pacearchaeota archaeon CG_4_9_14_0_2_um_filter_39_13]